MSYMSLTPAVMKFTYIAYILVKKKKKKKKRRMWTFLNSCIFLGFEIPFVV